MACLCRSLALVVGFGLLAGACSKGASLTNNGAGGSGGSASGGSGGNAGAGGNGGAVSEGSGGNIGSGGSGGNAGDGGSGGKSSAGGSGGKSGAGGSGGDSSDGAGGNGSGGDSSGGAGGNGSGGNSSGGTGGNDSGGNASGGAGGDGSGGSSGVGGAGGTSGTTILVSCESSKPASVVKASTAALTNFTPPDSAGTLAPAGIDSSGSLGTASWPYTQPVGNTYVYPAKTTGSGVDGGTCTSNSSGLTSSLNACDKASTPGVWTISGTVGTWSGAGLAFWCPVDASAFNGVQFDISGDLGPSGAITFSVLSCTDTTLTTCNSGTKSVTVTSATPTVSVLWSDLVVKLADGTAGPAFNRNIITGMGWGFGWYWPEDAGAPYQLNAKIDNLAWLP